MVVVKEKIRSQIVSVARKVFTRFGFKKATMEDIAKAASMGKSSIYYYFKSKEDIFRAVVEKEAEELKKELDKTLSADRSPIDKMKAYVRFRLSHLHTVANFYAALNEEDLSHMDFILKIRKDFDVQEQELVTELIQKGNEEGAFQITDPAIGAVALTTMMKGLELPLFLNSNRKKERQQLLDDLIRVIFYGIIKR